VYKQLSSKHRQEAIPGIFLPPLVTFFPGNAVQRNPVAKLAVQLELLGFRGDKPQETGGV
jgi:hypothetical protein